MSSAKPVPDTLVLLDTNAYLRLAKRVRPLLGVAYGQKRYVLHVLKEVEAEVNRNPRLRLLYPWFTSDPAVVAERRVHQVRLTVEERQQLTTAADFLHDWVLQDVRRFAVGNRQPPSPIDCLVLAFGQVRPAVVVTDDLGMHDLARDFDIRVWHGFELLAKLRTAKAVRDDLVREIYAALEVNADLPPSWRDARHTLLAKVFGPPPRS